MRKFAARTAILSVLGSVAVLALAAGAPPTPPVKAGRWEV